MRTYRTLAAVLAATLFAAPALAGTYRDATPVMTDVAAPNAPRESSFGFGAGETASPRSDRNWDDAAPATVIYPGSVSHPGSVDTGLSVDAQGHFQSLRF